MRRWLACVICIAATVGLRSYEALGVVQVVGRHAGRTTAGADIRQARSDAQPPALEARTRALLQSDGLPHLPDEHAPWNARWSNSIAICGIMRDENVTDVREWLQYHRWLGIDHVYLTENHSKVSMHAALRDFIESGFVTFHTEVQPHAQILVYKRCLMHRRGSHDWLAFIDVDEYLAVREGGTTLKRVLNDYRHFAGIALHWIFMGANNRTSRPPQGGVLRDYTACNPEPQGHVKVIANSFFVADVSVHPHNMRFRGQAVAVNDAKIPIANRYGIGSQCMGRGSHPNCFLTVGYDVPTPRERSVKRLALYHYVTKSLEDFQIKAQRGGGTRPIGKTKQFFDTIQSSSQSNAAICSELAKVADACCPRPASP